MKDLKDMIKLNNDDESLKDVFENNFMFDIWNIHKRANDNLLETIVKENMVFFIFYFFFSS